MLHSITQQFSQIFATIITELFHSACLFYCLQHVQLSFNCMLYVGESPCSLSQNTLNSSIMFISHIYKQRYEVDDHEVAILVPGPNQFRGHCQVPTSCSDINKSFQHMFSCQNATKRLILPCGSEGCIKIQ